MTEKTLAWHGDPALKAEVMERLRAHREADEFVQEVYQRLDPEAASGYRGCAIGCTLPPQPPSTFRDAEPGDVEQIYWHHEVERIYGINRRVNWAIDDTFESLNARTCGAFAVDVMEAIPVGADLTEVGAWVADQEDYADEAAAFAAELIERLSSAPVPTPA